MSSNNYILIERETKKVSMRDMNTDYELQDLGTGKDIDEAIDIAQKVMEDQLVEYGVYFKD